METSRLAEALSHMRNVHRTNQSKIDRIQKEVDNLRSVQDSLGIEIKKGEDAVEAALKQIASQAIEEYNKLPDIEWLLNEYGDPSFNPFSFAGADDVSFHIPIRRIVNRRTNQEPHPILPGNESPDSITSNGFKAINSALSPIFKKLLEAEGVTNLWFSGVGCDRYYIRARDAG